ncbi:hypothetical protein MO867_00385 [Microbulbifer sp. OS29]|uniref:Uncharacterized protein n=1 Tax=Microbulbifer okhotskensis TaxID=2926617 RepID=A0A9X2EIC7_9GAMM|nr:hypothetical protein [Microbulbifer okhotskensis]MCO1332782.1 hypothetical protein [Microbulbifer okhotskensis]
MDLVMMNDYPRALEITFDAVRNVGLAAALLGAAVIIIKAPTLAFNLTWLVYAEALLLAGLSVLLQLLNLVAWLWAMSRQGMGKLCLLLVGSLFVILLMHFYVAVVSNVIQGVSLFP